MATSGSTDFSLTSRQICTEALQMAGVTPIGEDPAAADAAVALRHLNLALKTSATDPKTWITTEGTSALTASTASYSLAAARRISSVRRRTSSIDTPLMAWSRQEYYDQPNKTATGLPLAYYFDPQRATRTLYVWPVPTTAIAASTTLLYTYQRVIEDSDSLDNDPDVPQEWLEALTYGVAARICIPFGIVTTNPARAGAITQQAAALYARLSADAEEDGSMFIQFDNSY